MSALLKTRETAVWLILMVVSVSNWVLGSQRSSLESDSSAAVLILLTLAFFKVSLIMQYFMEVRHANNELKVSCNLWLLAVFLLVTSANVGVFN
ncbi:cytochrome C oxidase subunit IV family protein [Zhongshania aliphaticivorans]|uniref:cytochrome C oxidase subunit IV family protein n=1 Tax=Zhongshania aliphaticivorans TaxID=1470434 RepID=UPI0012E6304F|nr:cytochrome C oxidase subunit IV family protein [Zhongshania aliphaticivorans]CAA0103084.1 Uncharacterised protein [Zhongshania aliphaticivorans]